MMMQPGLDVTDICEVSQNTDAEADISNFRVLSPHIHPGTK
jgi:hypothetical protein